MCSWLHAPGQLSRASLAGITLQWAMYSVDCENTRKYCSACERSCRSCKGIHNGPTQRLQIAKSSTCTNRLSIVERALNSRS